MNGQKPGVAAQDWTPQQYEPELQPGPTSKCWKIWAAAFNEAWAAAR